MGPFIQNETIREFFIRIIQLMISWCRSRTPSLGNAYNVLSQPILHGWHIQRHKLLWKSKENQIKRKQDCHVLNRPELITLQFIPYMCLCLWCVKWPRKWDIKDTFKSRARLINEFCYLSVSSTSNIWHKAKQS